MLNVKLVMYTYTSRWTSSVLCYSQVITHVYNLANVPLHFFSYHSYADDTQLILSFPQSETQVAARISAGLTDISQWMSAHHLKMNLDKTELTFTSRERLSHPRPDYYL